MVEDGTSLLEVTTGSFISGSAASESIMKTNLILIDALERVVFFDEAYEMGCVPKGDVRSLIMTELVKFMDTNKGLSVLIPAGYEKNMTDCFLTANEGLPRRFLDSFKLGRYSLQDLTHMFVRQVSEKMPENQSPFSPHELNTISKLLQTMLEYKDIDLFAYQAGDILNLSTVFVRCYYSEFKHPWQDGDVANNSHITMKAFREYLTIKKVKLSCIERILNPSSNSHSTTLSRKKTVFTRYRVSDCSHTLDFLRVDGSYHILFNETMMYTPEQQLMSKCFELLAYEWKAKLSKKRGKKSNLISDIDKIQSMSVQSVMFQRNNMDSIYLTLKSPTFALFVFWRDVCLFLLS